MERLIFLLLFPLSLFAEEITTNNLITNGTFENNNYSSWTATGDVTVLGDCCGSNYDLEFGDNGSIEQSFALTTDVITQQMLDNGVTLNSSVLVQNGECSVAGCWGGQGGADTFTIRLQIRDSDNNVLATTTQERTNVTGINGKDFTDSVSYTGTSSNLGNIFISGSDANAPNNLGGPNLDNISVTMTYDDTVLSQEFIQEIIEVSSIEIEELPQIILQEPEIIEVVFEEFVEETIQIKTIEEEFVEETIVLAVEIVEEIPVEIVQEEIEIMEEVYEEIIEAPVEAKTEETEGSEAEPEETVAELETSDEQTRSTSSSRNDINISVEEITIKVADKIKSIDGQLKATQLIVAKAMQKNKVLDKYAQVNANIFVQPEIIDANIDSYIASSYVDIRNIYSNNKYEDKLWILRQ